MTVKLLTEHQLEFLSLKGGCIGWSESTLVKMPHCWKSHVTAHIFLLQAVYVMPSSSARCSQLPRAVDKVPFYEALKKFRDHLTGKLPDLAESEICFPDLELKTAKKEPKKEGYEEIKMTADMKAEINDVAGSLLSQFSQGNYQVIPHSSASGFSNSQTINGLAMSQIKQEPQDSMLDNQSVCQIKQEPKESQPGSLPVTQIKQEPQDSGYVNQCVSVSQSQAAQTVSLYQTSTESKSPQSIQQSQESQSRKDSGIPDLSSVQQSRESQDSSLSNMPPLQQFVKVKQEPEEYKESSCTAGQSNASSYLPQYLNIDQSDPVPQNGNSFSSFLQGMYGMVNKVANQQQSTGNYGMVNLANQTHVSASQPLQFNQALCDIVRDVSTDMEPFDGVHSMSSSGLMATPPLGGGMAIKKEVDIEKTTKPKPRKRKSNSKLVSTVTSPSGENQVPFNSSSSYSSQSYPSTNASRSNVQGYPSMSNSSQSNPVGNYPPLTQPNNMPGVPSHNSPSMYPQQNFSHYPSITTAYQQQLATGNHYHQSNGNHYQSAPFPHPQQSFSQMMAQDPDWFRTYQYDQSAAPNMHSAFTRHPYPYSDKYPERQSYPTNPSQPNDLRMSAASSQAANDLAVDLRQALDKSSSNFETGLLQASDDHEKSKSSGNFLKQEKSEA